MDVALERHADAPDVDQVCVIVHEMYPGEWAGAALGLLRLVAAFELGETMRRVAFVREGARASGIDPGVSFAEIREIFGQRSRSLAKWKGDHFIGVRHERSRHPVPDSGSRISVFDPAPAL